MFILYWYTYAPATNTEERRKADTQGKLVVIMKVCMNIYDKHL